MKKTKEEIYRLFSPRFDLKRRKTNPSDVPPMVNNALVNVPIRGTSNKIHPTKETIPLVISPDEGRPSVNGQAQKVIILPAKEEAIIDNGIAAIPAPEKKKPGRPKKEKTSKK